MILKKNIVIIIMAITLTCNINGNLMEEYSKKEYCDTPFNCTSDFVNKTNVSKCPDANPLIELIFELPHLVQIRCLSANENVYNCLPLMKIGSVSRLRVYQCPILEDQSIIAILKNLEILKIENFEFYDSNIGKSLSHQHLSELDGLINLNLNNNNITKIPDDLFKNVSTITSLSLSHNKLQLPPNIFKNLPNLSNLNLSHNNLENLADGTFQNQKELNILDLTGNTLKSINKNTFEGLKSLRELNLTDNDIGVLHTDVFHHLGNLTHLFLNGNLLRVLPDHLFIKNERLENFMLKNNRVRMEKLPDRLFNATNQKIKRIALEAGLENIPSELFLGATNLRYLSLAHNKLTKLPIGVFVDQINLNYLDLSNNLLVKLDDAFRNTINLTTLILSGNQLKNISGTLFQNLRKLRKLYLQDNNIIFIDENAFTSTRSLEIIDLENNYLTKFMPLKGSITPLRILNLRNNSVSTFLNSLYSNNAVLKKLNELDLSFNNITTFSFEELSSLFYIININLTNNQITEIDLNIIYQIFRKKTQKNIRVYIENNPIDCDCGISTLVKYLDKYPDINEIRIEPGRLKCAKPQNFVHREVRALTLNELLCRWPLSSSNSSCPEPCKCYIHPIDDAIVPIIVDCSNLNLRKIPDLSVIGSMNSIDLYISNNYITELPLTNTKGNPEVKKIYASNNLITNIGVENLPNNIAILEIDNNKLSYLSEITISKLKNITSLQNLSLSGNSWRCDCESLEFLLFIQSTTELILDYYSIKCENGVSIKMLSRTDFCPKDNNILIAGCVTLALLGLISGVVVGLYFKFNQEIKAWLFAHNLCQWFVTEKELDQDKKYDAFITFSHKDEDFVLKHLMPNLESLPNPFKLCIHHRDWIVGEPIKSQIIKSVEESRKTIVVLSSNFLKSHWGRLEFLTAHTNAMVEGRSRVIIIIYEEIENLPYLDPELEGYISMHMNIKWSDPLFWEKLRYYLPHPQKNKKPNKGLIKRSFKRSLEKIELVIPSTSTALANNTTN